MLTLKQYVIDKQNALRRANKNPDDVFKIIFEFDPLIKNKIDYITYSDTKYKPSPKIEYTISYFTLSAIPVQRLLKNTSFFDNHILVNEGVFIPRDDSELMVEMAIDSIKRNNYKTCLDMCAGTGVLGISIKLATNIDLTSVDADYHAYKNIIENAELHNLDIEVIHGDFFNKVTKKYDFIICNPPYIDAAFDLDPVVLNFDPHHALIAPDHGLYYYKEIMKLLPKYLNPDGLLFLEIGFDQKEVLQQHLDKYYPQYKYQFFKDYAQNDRILIIKLK